MHCRAVETLDEGRSNDEKCFMAQSEPATNHPYCQASHIYELNECFYFASKTGYSTPLSQEFRLMPITRNKMQRVSGIPSQNILVTSCVTINLRQLQIPISENPLNFSIPLMLKKSFLFVSKNFYQTCLIFVIDIISVNVSKILCY